MNIEDDVRTLAKWLNEEQTSAIDKVALARVLAFVQKPADEPVAYVAGYFSGRVVVEPVNRALVMNTGTALYTTPPQRKPLTEKERISIAVEKLSPLVRVGAVSPIDAFNIGITAAEAAHGIKE